MLRCGHYVHQTLVLGRERREAVVEAGLGWLREHTALDLSRDELRGADGTHEGDAPGRRQ